VLKLRGRTGSNKYVSAHAEAEPTRVGEYDNLRSVLPRHTFCTLVQKALHFHRMRFRATPRPGVQVKMCLVILVQDNPDTAVARMKRRTVVVAMHELELTLKHGAPEVHRTIDV